MHKGGVMLKDGSSVKGGQHARLWGLCKALGVCNARGGVQG